MPLKKKEKGKEGRQAGRLAGKKGGKKAKKEREIELTSTEELRRVPIPNAFLKGPRSDREVGVTQCCWVTCV